MLDQPQHASGVPLATAIPVTSLGRTHEENTSYHRRHGDGHPVLGVRGDHDSISKTRGISAVLPNSRKIHQRGFSTVRHPTTPSQYFPKSKEELDRDEVKSNERVHLGVKVASVVEVLAESAA